MLRAKASVAGNEVLSSTLERCARPAPGAAAKARLMRAAVAVGSSEESSATDSTLRRACAVTISARLKVCAGRAKGPSGFQTRGAFPFKSLAVTYSGMACGHTTIGAERFHFRVRNGIGWFPLAMAARQTVSMNGPPTIGGPSPQSGISRFDALSRSR